MFLSNSRNTSGSLGEQLFRVLPNFHECFFNLIETRRTCFLFPIKKQTPKRKKVKLVNFDYQNANNFCSCLISFPDLLWTKPKARSGQIQICTMWSPVRNVTEEASAHAQHKFGAVKADLHGMILSRTSLRQAYDMTEEYSLESLNFVSFTKPNKHKMRLKGLFYNLAGFVFEYFCDSRRILATFAKFCLNPFFATWSCCFTRHPARARSSSPPSPTQVFWRKKV